MGVVATRSPHRIPELLAYLIQIVRVNQEFEGSGWAVYDETFRRQAAVSGNQQWSKLNASLFSLCFTGRTQNGKMQLVSEHHPHNRDMPSNSRRRGAIPRGTRFDR